MIAFTSTLNPVILQNPFRPVAQHLCLFFLEKGQHPILLRPKKTVNCMTSQKHVKPAEKTYNPNINYYITSYPNIHECTKGRSYYSHNRYLKQNGNSISEQKRWEQRQRAWRGFIRLSPKIEIHFPALMVAWQNALHDAHISIHQAKTIQSVSQQ